jgi:hypothetical protein
LIVAGTRIGFTLRTVRGARSTPMIAKLVHARSAVDVIRNAHVALTLKQLAKLEPEEEGEVFFDELS